MCRKNSRKNETAAYTTDKTIQFSVRPKANNSTINVRLLSRIKSYIALDYNKYLLQSIYSTSLGLL